MGMANIKFVAVSRGLSDILDYVTNREKTVDSLITGVNCVAQTAQDEFEAVKKHFRKTDGRSYYHIVMNSVNFETGQKFHQTVREMQQAKEFSNQLCREYGLSVTESKADPFHIPKWKKRLRNTIKEAMENCANRQEFIEFLQEYGYQV